MSNARRFLVNAAVLTVTSLFMNIIGVWFNLYISNKIGMSAMGVFQLILSVYSLGITVATSGIHLTATRLVAEEMGRNNQPGMLDAMRKCFLYALVFGVCTAVALYVLAPVAGTRWIGDTAAVRPLRLMALGLPLVPLSCAMNGYFTAVRRVAKNSGVQITEQVLRIVLTIVGLTMLAGNSLEGICMAMIAASVIAEFVSCAGSAVIYRMDRGRYACKRKAQQGMTKRMLYIGLPIAFSSYLRSGLLTLKNLLVPSRLRQAGMTQQNAHAVFGTIHGVVLPTVLFCSVFLSAFCSLIVPELTECHAKAGGGSVRNNRHIHSMVDRMFHVTLLFSIGTAGVLFCFADSIAPLVSSNANIPFYLRLFAPLIPVMYTDTAVDSMLKGLNEQMSSMRYNIIDAFVSVVLVCFLLPVWGVKGYILVIFTSELLNGALSLNRLIRVVDVRFRLGKWLFKPLGSIAVAGAAARILLVQVTGMPGVVLGIAATVGFYALLLLVTGCVTREDLQWGIHILFPGAHGHSERPSCA